MVKAILSFLLGALAVDPGVELFVAENDAKGRAMGNGGNPSVLWAAIRRRENAQSSVFA